MYIHKIADILNSRYKMARDRKKVLHIHSSVPNKQPKPELIEFGELAVNNANEGAFISTKNDEGEIVRFSEDETIVNWMEMKDVFPYEGYVRGSDRNSSGVTENDLAENKSNIIIKLNQFTAKNSEYDEKVNNARDIYGNLVNPASPDGHRDGAGFAIDMSPYAMVGSNPSFSSISSDCHTVLNGTTEINGGEGDCGSSLHVNVNEICEEADDKATVYGKAKTNLGVSCDESDASEITNLAGGGVNIEAGQDLNMLGEEVSLSGGTIQETAGSGMTVYGNTETNIGTTCGDDPGCNVSSVTNVYGYEVNGSSDTDLNLNAGRDVTIGASDTISANGSDICINASNEASLYGSHKTTIGVSCGGEITQDLTVSAHTITVSGESTTIYRNPNENFSSTTIEGAINEAYLKSRVTVERTPAAASSDTLVSYDLYQAWDSEGEKVKIATIDIPKDFLVVDSAVVRGTWNGSEFIEDPTCEGSSCGRAIKLVINTKDPQTGHAVYKNIYVNVDDLVKDITIENPSDRGVTLSLEYDGSKNVLSATTSILLNGVYSTPIDGVNNITIDAGDIYLTDFGRDCENENQNNPDIVDSDTIADAICKLNNGKVNPDDIKSLRLAYGDTRDSESITYNPYSGASSFMISQDVQDLYRQKLEWRYGDVKGLSGSTYDPGEGIRLTDRTYTEKLIIPSTLKDLTNDLDYLKFTKGAFLDSENPKQYNGSVEKTVNIPSDAKHISMRGIEFVSGTFSGETYSPKDGEEGLDNFVTRVYVPTRPSHIGMQTVTFEKGASSANTQTIEFDGSTNKTVYVPEDLSQMLRGTLTYSHNGYEGTFDPASGVTFMSPHSALTVNYGVTCGVEESSVTYDTSASRTITIPKTISDITNGAIEIDGCDGDCITINKDICSNGAINASAVYSSSDRNLKENILDLTEEDYKKVEGVNFKTFNFKSDKDKKKSYGVIAQEVKAAGLDEIVHKNEYGNLSVDYTSLLILKIADLEDTIKKLSEEIDKLRK